MLIIPIIKPPLLLGGFISSFHLMSYLMLQVNADIDYLRYLNESQQDREHTIELLKKEHDEVNARAWDLHNRYKQLEIEFQEFKKIKEFLRDYVDRKNILKDEL